MLEGLSIISVLITIGERKMLDYMSYNIMNSDAAKEKILQILNKGNYDEKIVEELNRLAKQLNDYDALQLKKMFNS